MSERKTKLSDLIASVATRGASLPSETGLFIVLQVAEAMRESAGVIDAEQVWIGADGEVTLEGARGAGEEKAVHAIAALTERVLHTVPSGARRMLRRAHDGTITTLSALRAELEAQLVPLNRAAATRVLARQVREFARAQQGGSSSAVDTAPGGDALATAPDGKNRGILNDALDPPNESIPRFPRPAGLGGLTSPDDHRGEREPDVRPSVPVPAVDTIPDGTTARTSEPPGADEDAVSTHVDAPVDARRARREPRRERGTMTAAIALIVLGLGALLYWQRTHAPSNVMPQHAAP